MAMPPCHELVCFGLRRSLVFECIIAEKYLTVSAGSFSTARVLKGVEDFVRGGPLPRGTRRGVFLFYSPQNISVLSLDEPERLTASATDGCGKSFALACWKKDRAIVAQHSRVKEGGVAPKKPSAYSSII